MSFRRFSRRLVDRWSDGGGARVVVATVDSTNSLARRVAAAYRSKGDRTVAATFIAYHQSRGRGRGDHGWESPPGEGIYASLLLPEIDRRRLAGLPLLAGLGLAAAAGPMAGRDVTLRWPNDLMVGERKLGGILIESIGPARGEVTAVVGFGINYGRTPIARATSILAESRRAGRPEPEELADAVTRLVAGVVAELAGLDDIADTARRYAAASVHRRGERLRCRTPAGTIEGRFCGFDERGFLRLETAEGERSMGAGELVWAGEAR